MTAFLGDAVRRWTLFVVLLAGWEVATRVAGDPFFPPPTVIAPRVTGTWIADLLHRDVLPSLGRMSGGFAIAAVAGIVLGTVLGLSRTGMDYAGPVFSFARAIPPPVLIPVFLTIFHIGAGTQVALIAAGAVWPVLLNTVDGVRSIDPTRRDAMRSLNTPVWHRIGLVILPGALPKIFAGLRLSLSIALILMVVSEMVGAANGIGYQLLFAQRQFDFPMMWAGVALLGVLGYTLNVALLRIERGALHWQPSGSAGF
jgi:ABC-type nitrate/sulfonate/bicarbonate transport system permease component